MRGSAAQGYWAQFTTPPECPRATVGPSVTADRITATMVSPQLGGGEGWLAVTCAAVSDWRFQSRKVQKTSKTWKIQHEPSRLSDRRQIIVLRSRTSTPRDRLWSLASLSSAVGSLHAVVLEVAIHARGVARVREDLVDRMRCRQAARKCISSVGADAVAASWSLALLRIVPRPRIAPCDES